MSRGERLVFPWILRGIPIANVEAKQLRFADLEPNAGPQDNDVR